MKQEPQSLYLATGTLHEQEEKERKAEKRRRR
jgi:hypothetical protein